MPTCPGWTLKQLLRHVGRGDRWAAQIVADRHQERLDPRTVPRRQAARRARTARIDGCTPGRATLIDAVAETGADAAVWTFIGPRPAVWWIRRRLHEVVVHRADAAIAVGAEFTVDPALAADCHQRMARARRHAESPVGVP